MSGEQTNNWYSLKPRKVPEQAARCTTHGYDSFRHEAFATSMPDKSCKITMQLLPKTTGFLKKA